MNRVEGERIIKIKGITEEALNGTVDLRDLKNLLFKNSNLEVAQEKWYKKMYTGGIDVRDTVYQLAMTSNKRKPIYLDLDERRLQTVMIDTEPYNYNEFEKGK